MEFMELCTKEQGTIESLSGHVFTYFLKIVLSLALQTRLTYPFSVYTKIVYVYMYIVHKYT